MKKILKISSVSLLLTLCFSGITVSAARRVLTFSQQTATTTQNKIFKENNRDSNKDTASSTTAQIRKASGDLRGQIDARKKELQNNKQARQMENVKKIAKQTIERAKAAIERLQKIADRLDSRIAKIEKDRQETAKAKADMVIARQKLSDTEKKLSDIK